MIYRSFVLTAASLVFLALVSPISVVLADEPATEAPTSVPTPASPKQVEKTPLIAIAPIKVAPVCKPAPLPAYIENWDRLADLTREDSEVFPRAEFWAKRHEVTSSIRAGGLIVGGGAFALGVSAWLTDDDLSRRAKWSMVGGIGVELVSAFVYWAFDPDRDDLLTVINQWNFHHPDRPLAP